MERTYFAIDLKSFYASVECVARGLDPLNTHLVVADESRTDKTICLAVSPALKAQGVSGRPRLFEVNQRVRHVNRQRQQANGGKPLTGESHHADALESDPSLALKFIIAPPRMKLYEDYSTRIFGIYLNYVSDRDMVVYSIDEVFMDVTDYLKLYGKSPRALAMTIIQDVYRATGITATAGIGENLYLAKVAMDIVAKHVPPDENGVRLAELSEMAYRRQLWDHTPLTDFWRIGRGTAAKLSKMQLRTMGDVARASLNPAMEDMLYRAFGVNAELIIDHAWGWEPVTVAHIKAYRPASSSIGAGQVLPEPYSFDKGRIILREMMESLCLDLVRKRLLTKQIVIDINYDQESLQGRGYKGPVVNDFYGRTVPKPMHGSANVDHYTASAHLLTQAAMDIYDSQVRRNLLIRRVNVGAANVIAEEDAPAAPPEQMDMFTDYAALDQQKAQEKRQEDRERRLQQVTLGIQQRYGKNAMLKGTNLLQGATAMQRNGQIGGHKAE